MQYKHAWQAVAEYHKHQYGITWDASGKDISRLCYVSYDPNLHSNPGARPFVVPPFEPPTPKAQPTPQPTSGSVATTTPVTCSPPLRRSRSQATVRPARIVDGGQDDVREH